MSAEFLQAGPELKNTFTQNIWLGAYLRKCLPKVIQREVFADLERFGELCAGPFLRLARQAEREKPVHVPFSPWGERIDEIRVSEAWVELQNVSAREGLIQIGYARRIGEYSRIYQFAKLYLFHPSSAFFTCPLAMADGAAKVLEVNKGEGILDKAFHHLTSVEPKHFWTSGQWMTERAGGSDVSRTETVARIDGGKVRLYGTKWFSSATTSQMALALARYDGAGPGSKGLSLFLVPMRTESGNLNGIRVLRLKDKLGTLALPTAELELSGAEAYPVGPRDHGVKTVATMLNITRLYNSVCSVGQATRALEQMRDYSAKREVFGARLESHLLHQGTFAREEVRTLAGFLLTFDLVSRLGREECGTASAEDKDLLRLMTPICKLFTARSSLQTAGEVVEGFGGAGYIEDTGIPIHLRDSQVFSIWEGATNVLSMDLLRVVQKGSALASLESEVARRIGSLASADLRWAKDDLASRWQKLTNGMSAWLKSTNDSQVASSRSLSFHLAWHFAGLLLLSWAESEAGENRTTLLEWYREMRNEMGEFNALTEDQCQSLRSAFAGRLEF